ncbi:MAG: hypothetical protein A2X34_02485 [Elusimicrobia bacterium GWC2_51_8]|nr:MAG: hypothetical protein A2X33_00860 [Elusimicrobia bacterium GWA2_51_34]OGR60176.1 MAG: hypothetical protein A2X34_02485 [Elusimicrobia bacterium GWC2_51_8]HAF94806.1 hypothetical protein [Elusimicrobiota bacterium]HCE98884.1 hypothetical protein [Elusimicrobiota bacterium]
MAADWGCKRSNSGLAGRSSITRSPLVIRGQFRRQERVKAGKNWVFSSNLAGKSFKFGLDSAPS